MNFMEAVKVGISSSAMKTHRDGHNYYMELEEGIIIFKGKKDNKLWGVQNISTEDVDSLKWEIYEEEKKWNLADKRPISIDGIKTFIQKVKEDITEEMGKYIIPNLYLEKNSWRKRIQEIIDKRAGDL